MWESSRMRFARKMHEGLEVIDPAYGFQHRESGSDRRKPTLDRSRGERRRRLRQ